MRNDALCDEKHTYLPPIWTREFNCNNLKILGERAFPFLAFSLNCHPVTLLTENSSNITAKAFTFEPFSWCFLGDLQWEQQ